MNTIRVLATIALIAYASAYDDLILSPLEFAAYESTNTWFSLLITNNMSVSATSVTFKVYPPGGSVISISYIGAGSDASVGTINSGAGGSGSFAMIGCCDGSYFATVSVNYKKSGISKQFNQTVELDIVDPDGNGKKRAAIAPVAEYVEEGQVVEVRSDLDTRDTYLNIVTSAVYAEAGVATWNAMQVSVGSIQVNNVSFIITSMDGGVTVAYAFPNGNYIGTVAANSNANGYFQTSADCGYYNLNATVSYKLQGTSTVRKVWKVILLSVTGDGCEGGDTLGKRSSIVRSDMENASANGMRAVPVEYAVAVGIAGVALVAVFSVVGTIFLMKRRNQETISA